jgi:hypothetical protein
MTDLHPDFDILRPGVKCAHCGFQMRGSAAVADKPVCHTGPPYPDCYRLITVYHEPLGSRRPLSRVDEADDRWADERPEGT